MIALTLAIPSKGRLQEQALKYFADAGLAISQDGGHRGYVARMASLPDVEVRLLSASDIALALRDGAAHAGVTGEDLLREIDARLERVAPIVPLGFGRADLVVAVPSAWIDVATMEDLDEVSEATRARTGRRLRIATKYVRQTHAYFAVRGVDDYRIVESLGATEGAPAAGVADIIVDITTTGATLTANHLKPLDDGPILKSQAHLAVSRAADWGEAARRAMRRVLDQLEARDRGRALKLVRAAPGRADPRALAALADRFGGRPAGDPDPQGTEGGHVAFYVPGARAADAAAAAAALGAGPIGVLAAEFVFDAKNAWSAAFSRVLGDLSRPAPGG